MNQQRRALSIEHLGPEIYRALPPEIPRSVGEDVTPNALYSTGESPTLKFPQVFEWLRDHPTAPSSELLAELERTNYTLLIGLSGGGRNIHIERLCKLFPNDYAQSMSMTTRPFRIDTKTGQWERQGTSYNHRSAEQVIAEIMRGRFFEWEIIHRQQVSGTHISSLASIPNGMTAVNETEPGGSRSLYEAIGRPSIFLLPEPFEAWIDNRILTLPVAEQQRRMESAKRNIQTALDNPYYAFFGNTIVCDAERETALTQSAMRLHRLIQILNSGGIGAYLEIYATEHARLCDVAEQYVCQIEEFTERF